MQITRKFWLACALLLIPAASQAGLISDIGMWLQNINDQLPAILRLIVAISYVTGVVFVALGVFKLKAYGQMTIYQSANASMSGPLIFLAIGIILFTFPTIVDVMIYTLWGYGSEDVPGYSSIGGNYTAYIAPVIGIIQIIGYISFLRGWYILSKLGTSGAQPGTLTKSISHIVGGILAINVMGSWETIKATIGIL